jgi:CheY-like chemotaxis protein
MNPWILLVEDEPDDVFFFQSAAKKAGLTHAIEVATDGRSAVARLSRVVDMAGAETPPSLVLLDLKLPYLSGLEVLEWLRRQPALHAVPALMLTSSDQENDIENAYRLGAFGYLVKAPAPTMVGLVRAIDEFWLKRNHVPALKIRPAEMGAAAVAT